MDTRWGAGSPCRAPLKGQVLRLSLTVLHCWPPCRVAGSLPPHLGMVITYANLGGSGTAVATPVLPPRVCSINSFESRLPQVKAPSALSGRGGNTRTDVGGERKELPERLPWVTGARTGVTGRAQGEDPRPGARQGCHTGWHVSQWHGCGCQPQSHQVQGEGSVEEVEMKPVHVPSEQGPGWSCESPCP